ncbi:ATP-binding protein [Kitasatospora sp. NPDC008115]|uniref:ATP-binding protein n=1 Tax=Kitasatospora sp. NPDC008115 TaxID=3364022 RepID=UPI0036E68288
MPFHCTARRPREFATRLAPKVESTPLARTILRAYLAGMPQGERYSDIGELLLGELFANAVQHGDAPPDRLIEIRFAITIDRLRLEVHDAGTGRPALRPAATPDDEHGRGLFLVDELAERWGCCPRASGIGKFVWALIAPAPGSTDLAFGRAAGQTVVAPDMPVDRPRPYVRQH